MKLGIKHFFQSNSIDIFFLFLHEKIVVGIP